MLTTGQQAIIVKGCNARGINKGSTVRVDDVRELGADYSHMVRVGFTVLNGLSSGKSFAFYARHRNRLSDVEVQMNDGNPTHTVRLKARS